MTEEEKQGAEEEQPTEENPPAEEKIDEAPKEGTPKEETPEKEPSPEAAPAAKPSKERDKGITEKREEDMPEWYQQVCLKAELADFSPVKGFMIIRPNGYAIWQRIMDYFNIVLKEKKVENAYFPLLIPESFFQREAQHAEGFAPELAWVSRKSEDAERLAIRPTSETIMYDAYSKWIRSWRDLPLRIIQWCNVLRWEVSDVKLFLRSREFLWQEGHCVYATEEECEKETKMIAEEYKRLAEDLLAVPTLTGLKSELETFPGALKTYTVETFTAEGKALQLGTSHNLGQGFAKSFNISFLDQNEKEALPWQSSWGISTRMIGAAVMIHSDNKGLVLPPRVAQHKVVIVPIFMKGKDKDVLKKAREIKAKLKQFDALLDDREEYSPGWKFNDWEMKGIPIRLEFGPRDLQNNEAVLVRRDNGNKLTVPLNKVTSTIPKLLEDIQNSLLKKAKEFLESSIVDVDSWSEFEKAIEDKKLARGAFCVKKECEEKIKEKTQATSRCISSMEKKGKCVHCNNESSKVAYFGKAY
ncbi:MAG: proline--tRNA ligase [Candidatus Woesearchaeota archaeon]|nr:proline--tRNA ligase [Candidatus Woesearchaeota archaeon]